MYPPVAWAGRPKPTLNGRFLLSFFRSRGDYGCMTDSLIRSADPIDGNGLISAPRSRAGLGRCGGARWAGKRRAIVRTLDFSEE